MKWQYKWKHRGIKIVFKNFFLNWYIVLDYFSFLFQHLIKSNKAIFTIVILFHVQKSKWHTYFLTFLPKLSTFFQGRCLPVTWQKWYPCIRNMFKQVIYVKTLWRRDNAMFTSTFLWWWWWWCWLWCGTIELMLS